MKGDHWLKIASVVFALAIWVFVMFRGDSEMSIAVPVEFTSVVNGLEVVEPVTVNIFVRGHERFLGRLSPDDINISYSLEGMAEGEHKVSITSDIVDVPAPLKVEAVTPSTTTISLDRTLKKTVTLKARVVGLPEEGYILDRIRVEPSRVEVEGPKSVVGPLKRLETMPVDISQATSSLAVETAVNINDRRIRISPDTVTMHIEIEKEHK